MTYDQAKSLGLEMGLSEPAEFINNIALHAMNPFVYTMIPTELEELRSTAKEASIEFSLVCGDAVFTGESVDEPCYMCRKFEAFEATLAEVGE
jgi:hypothetical protein